MPVVRKVRISEVMAKPGHLINALRRYPYAVDAMRVQAADVKSAEKVCIAFDRFYCHFHKYYLLVDYY